MFRRHPRRLALLAAATVVALAAATAPASRAVATTGGYGDWACAPAAGKHPVVLLHGLGGDPVQNWSYVGPRLAAAGYCAFASPYSAPQPGGPPFYGLAAVDESAAEVADYIDAVLAATGADRVNLVGHSEGGFLSLYVPKMHGYASKLASVVALAPPTHGTSFLGLVPLALASGTWDLWKAFLEQGGCPACADLVVGGAAVSRIEDGPIAQAAVRYTVIATRTDILVRNEAYRPATDTAFVREPGVTNYYVQDRCPLDLVGHVGLAFDEAVFEMILQGLDPSAPPPRCTFGLPL